MCYAALFSKVNSMKSAVEFAEKQLRQLNDQLDRWVNRMTGTEKEVKEQVELIKGYKAQIAEAEAKIKELVADKADEYKQYRLIIDQINEQEATIAAQK